MLKSKQKAFTLIEVIISIVILGFVLGNITNFYITLIKEEENKTTFNDNVEKLKKLLKTQLFSSYNNEIILVNFKEDDIKNIIDEENLKDLNGRNLEIEILNNTNIDCINTTTGKNECSFKNICYIKDDSDKKKCFLDFSILIIDVGNNGIKDITINPLTQSIDNINDDKYNLINFSDLFKEELNQYSNDFNDKVNSIENYSIGKTYLLSNENISSSSTEIKELFSLTDLSGITDITILNSPKRIKLSYLLNPYLLHIQGTNSLENFFFRNSDGSIPGIGAEPFSFHYDITAGNQKIGDINNLQTEYGILINNKLNNDIYYLLRKFNNKNEFNPDKKNYFFIPYSKSLDTIPIIYYRKIQLNR